jgi:hypothetical protein
MSGYSGGVIEPEHLIGDGVALIEKPFTVKTLLRSVRAAMTGGARTRSGPGSMEKTSAARNEGMFKALFIATRGPLTGLHHSVWPRRSRPTSLRSCDVAL